MAGRGNRRAVAGFHGTLRTAFGFDAPDLVVAAARLITMVVRGGAGGCVTRIGELDQYVYARNMPESCLGASGFRWSGNLLLTGRGRRRIRLFMRILQRYVLNDLL